MENEEKRQPNDIAKASNKTHMLIVTDKLYPTVYNYASVFADKEEVNGQKLYSRVELTLIEKGGSKNYVKFYLEVDQCDYLYLLSKDCQDVRYESFKEGKITKVKRKLTVNRNTYMKGEETSYPWYIAINNDGNQMFINLTDEDFFSLMSRIHRWINLVANNYAGYLMKKKFDYEHGNQ